MGNEKCQARDHRDNPSQGLCGPKAIIRQEASWLEDRWAVSLLEGPGAGA